MPHSDHNSRPPSNRQLDSRGFPAAQDSAIKAILFDCDGVICPPLRFAQLLANDYAITRAMTAEFFGSTFNQAILGQADVLNLLPQFLKQWGWEESAQSFLDLWLTSEREVRPEILGLVADLRHLGFKVGLATNQEANRAHYMRNEMGFNRIFDHCFISSEMGAMKPQAEYYKVATDTLGVEPNQIAFIDDQVHYLDAAASFGWQTIHFDGRIELQDELAMKLRNGG